MTVSFYEAKKPKGMPVGHPDYTSGAWNEGKGHPEYTCEGSVSNKANELFIAERTNSPIDSSGIPRKSEKGVTSFSSF